MEHVKSWDADVVVVGAGPAGSGFALRLARQGFKVLVLDRSKFPREKTCGGGLTPRAVAALEDLGLLKRLLGRLSTYRIGGALLFSPSGHRWRMDFSAVDFGLPSFGLIVTRLDLDAFLLEEAEEAGANFLPERKVTGFLRSDGRIVGVKAVHPAGEEEIRAPLVAIATGASIALHRKLGLLRSMPPVVLSARGYYSGVDGLGDVMEFYFESELMPGYAWIFPVGDGIANIGVGTFPVAGVKKNPYRLLDWFLREGQAAERLSGARLQSAVSGYPLRTDYPSHPVSGEGFLLLGESTGLVNPVTGEGIDLALESAELASGVAMSALKEGDFSRKMLSKYDGLLRNKFGSYFSGMRVLRDRAVNPYAMDRIIRAASDDPGLAKTVAGINLGVLPPQVILKRPGLAFRATRYFLKKFLRIG